MSYRYLIQCERMHREDVFIASSHTDLMRRLELYVVAHGPIVLLYQVGRI